MRDSFGDRTRKTSRSTKPGQSWIVSLSLVLSDPGLLCVPRAQAPGGAATRDHSCGDNAAQIMLLGTCHMNNPGQDAINPKTDDVLGQGRQREIAELIDKLVRFNPTKIAVEAPYRSTVYPDR